MVKWDDPKVVGLCAFIFQQASVFLAGFYGWEFVLTFWFDWAIFTRKISFKFAHIIYFLGRYCMLFALVSLIVIIRINHEMNCQLWLPLITAVGSVASACATTNLMIRTLAIWHFKKVIVYPLTVISFGHFFFLVYVGSSNMTSHWDEVNRACALAYKNDALLASIFLYTVLYDFVILILTLVGISTYCSPSRSGTLRTLYSQGILYFIFTCMVNFPALLFSWLNLNEPMNAMFSPPASTISIMVSSRAVVSLMENSRKSEAKKAELNSSPHTTHRISSNKLTTHVAFPLEVYGIDTSDIHSSREDRIDRSGSPLASEPV